MRDPYLLKQRFSVASETQTSGWKEQIIIGDWVLVHYDNTFYPGEVKNKRGDDIQVNVMIPAGKTRWKWPKKSTMKGVILSKK